MYQLTSSGIVGQSKANTILQGFQKASGLTAVLQTVTAGKPYYIVTSAAQANQSSTDAPYTAAKRSKDQREDSKAGALKMSIAWNQAILKTTNKQLQLQLRLRNKLVLQVLSSVWEKQKLYREAQSTERYSLCQNGSLFQEKKWRYTSKRFLLHSHIKS